MPPADRVRDLAEKGEAGKVVRQTPYGHGVVVLLPYEEKLIAVQCDPEETLRFGTPQRSTDRNHGRIA
jgi:hypothetical protein